MRGIKIFGIAALTWVTGLALLAPADQALAGPIAFSSSGAAAFQSDKIKATTVVNDVYSFHLAADQTLSGSLQTGGATQLDIRSAYLIKADGTGRIEFGESTAVSWADIDAGLERWTLASAILSAGDWELHVIGEGFGSKKYSSYVGNLSEGTVPEPQTLLLSVAALAAMGVVARKRKTL